MATINGTNNDDVLYSSNVSDRISSVDGNDTIYAGGGYDTIDGGADIDTLRVSGNSADYWTTSSGYVATIYDFGGVASSSPVIQLGGLYSNQMQSIEILQFDDKTLYWDGFGWDEEASFTHGDDTVSGSSQNEFMDGQGGNDTLLGMSGKDLLRGENGDDSLSGGTGNDLLFGGNGNDTLRGGEDNDLLAGEDGSDQLYGGKGEDTLRGMSGDDLLYGDTGNDQVEAASGSDTVYGGEGDDLILISTGDHTLFGGKGVDTFFIFRFDESQASTAVINDFSQGLEVIDVSNTDYTSIAYGVASGAVLGYSYVGGNTVIHASLGDSTLSLKGQFVLTEADFIF